MNKDWNAFVDRDLVVNPTDTGTLDGLSFAVKDVFHIQGYTSSAGNPDWLKTHEPAPDHAASIKRLLNQGARLTGTTHTDELMYSLDGENEHYGTPINPKSPERIPGGSSSGSAVAVSAGLVDFALGTDTGGSVRIPSSYCGVYGFRPTHGSVDIAGVIPLALSFDTVGWMARDPQIMLKVGQVLLGEEQSHTSNFEKFYLGKEAWELTDAEWREKGLDWVEQSVGKGLKWINLTSSNLSEWVYAFRTLQALEVWETHGEWIEQHQPRFGEAIGNRFRWANSLEKKDSERPIEIRKRARELLVQLLGIDGLLIIPTAPGIAPLRGESGEAVELRRARTLQLCCIAGLAGLPQVTLPIAKIDGSPIGLSILAGHGQDIKLLRWVHDIFKGRGGSL